MGAKEFKEKKLGVLWNRHTSDVFRPCRPCILKTLSKWQPFLPVNSPRIPWGDTPLIYVQPWALYAVITASSFARPVSIPTHTASCKQCLYPMYNTDSVSVCVWVCYVHVCAYMCRCFRYWQHGHGKARHAIVNYVINRVGVK